MDRATAEPFPVRKTTHRRDGAFSVSRRSFSLLAVLCFLDSRDCLRGPLLPGQLRLRRSADRPSPSRPPFSPSRPPLGVRVADQARHGISGDHRPRLLGQVDLELLLQAFADRSGTLTRAKYLSFDSTIVLVRCPYWCDRPYRRPPRDMPRPFRDCASLPSVILKRLCSTWARSSSV